MTPTRSLEFPYARQRRHDCRSFDSCGHYHRLSHHRLRCKIMPLSTSQRVSFSLRRDTSILHLLKQKCQTSAQTKEPSTCSRMSQITTTRPTVCSHCVARRGKKIPRVIMTITRRTVNTNPSTRIRRCSSSDGIEDRQTRDHVRTSST